LSFIEDVFDGARDAAATSGLRGWVLGDETERRTDLPASAKRRLVR
jgi:hypothetical protein